MITFMHVWLLALAPLPLAVYWLLAPRTKSATAVRVPFLNRLQAAGASHTSAASSNYTASITRVFIWLCLVTALAKPVMLEEPIEKTIPTRDLLLLVDLSGSMDHEDFTSTSGEPINRLEAVKEVLGDFLLKREGDRIGLVVFGNSPFLQVPFTTDLALCAQLLNETGVGMAGPRTALGDAIGLGIQQLKDTETPQKTIIALTDGNDTASAVPPIEAARIARDNDITIHTIAIGDPITVGEEKIDEQTLKTVAESTQGQFFLALNRQELTGIYDSLNEIETLEAKTVSHQPRTELYFWPLGIALVLSMLLSLVKAYSRRDVVSSSTTSVRLRVNRQTFALEATEQ